jgi:hypothetical protein
MPIERSQENLPDGGSEPLTRGRAKRSIHRRKERDAKEESPSSGMPETLAASPGTHRLHNRVRAILAHGWCYAFEPTERLARDVGVSPRTMRRLLSGQTANPPFRLVEAVTAALSRDLRLPDPLLVREVFSPDGTYPTPSTCDLCDCGGCLPEGTHDRQGRLKPEYRDARPGDWCRYPAAD